MGDSLPLPAKSGISPIDKLLKDGALPPVTSEKSTLFFRLLIFCTVLYPSQKKAMAVSERRYLIKNSYGF
jgi:hypothetical protein